ncbi:MAG: MFS transporter [Paraclostridium sp.]
MNKKWRALTIIAMASFIMVIDSTAMNVSISNLVNDLHTDISTIQLIMASYTLIMAICMLPGAKIADIIGSKKAFIFGAILYGVGTLTASISQNVVMLFIGWALIEGVAAALMMPTALALITAAYKGKDRVIAMSIYTAMSSVALAIGPIFGGIITTYFSWRYVFAIEALIVVYILINFKAINEIDCEQPSKDAKFDFLGSLISAIALISIVGGALQSKTYGWIISKKAFNFGFITLPKGSISISILLILNGLLFLGIFILWLKVAKNNNKQALIDIDIFKYRNFDVVLLINACIQISLAGIMFVTPIYLQSVLKYDALKTGMTIMPLSITLLITSMFVVKLISKFDQRYIICTGAMSILLGGAYMYFIFNGAATVSGIKILPAMLFLGMGIGCSLTLTSNIALSAIDKKLSNQGSGMITTVNNLASSLSTAVIGSVLISGINVGIAKYLISDFSNQFGKYSVHEILGKINETTTRLNDNPIHKSDLSNNQIHQIMDIITRGMNSSMQRIFIIVIAMAILAGIIALIGISIKKNSNNEDKGKVECNKEQKAS